MYYKMDIKKYVVEISSDPSVKTFTDLSELLNDVAFNNVTFQVEDKFFHANRALLAKHSPYFRAMFGGNFVENKSKQIESKSKSTKFKQMLDYFSHFFEAMYVENFEECENESIKLKLIAADAFQQILNYIYSGSIEVAPNEIVRLWEAANFLGIEFISKKCVDLVLGKCDEKLIEVFVCVNDHCQEEIANILRIKIHDIIDEISDTIEFLKLSADDLIDLFKNCPQDHAYKFLGASFKWILNRSPDDGDFERFPNILGKLNFSSINHSDLLNACQKDSLRSLMREYPHIFGTLIAPLVWNN